MAKMDIKATAGEIKEGDILFSKDVKRKVATITLNRPEKLNALTLAHWVKMRDLILSVDEDDDVKVLILKGSGRALCSGHDVANIGVQHGILSEKDERPSQRQRLIVDMDYWHGRRGLWTTLKTCRKITICQAHGYCYGGGFIMVIQSDLCIAAEDALFTHSGYRYIGPTTDPWSLSQTIGMKRTNYMTITGTPINAALALEWGLVNDVVPLSKLEEEINKMADKVALLPADAIVLGKQQLISAWEAAGMQQAQSNTGLVHALQTGMRFEPGEYNLLKERRDKGLKGAILARKAFYGEGDELIKMAKSKK